MKKVVLALAILFAYSGYAQNKKLSELPIASNATGAVVLVTQGGVSKQLPVTSLPAPTLKTVGGTSLFGTGDIPLGGGAGNPLSIINPQLRGSYKFVALATGQSNVVGGSLVSPPGVDTSMDARVQVWDSATNKFVTAINGVNYPQFPTPSSPTSVFYFGKRYIAEHPLDTFRIIMVAQGSSEINEWHDGITPKNFLVRLIAQAAASGIDHTDMMLWGQGELTNGADNEQNYILRQDSLFATMRRQAWFSKDTKILVQGMPDMLAVNSSTGLQDTTTAGHNAVDRWKQKSDYDGDPFTAYVPTVRLKANPPNGEIHYNALGLYEFGYNRMYEVFKNMPRNFYTEIGGLANTSWQVGGNNIPNGNPGLYSKLGTRNTQSLEVIQNNVGKIQFIPGQTLHADGSGTYFNGGQTHNFGGTVGVSGFIRVGSLQIGNLVTTLELDGTNNIAHTSSTGHKFYINNGATLSWHISTNGGLYAASLKTVNAAPTTTGVTRMAIVDEEGKFSSSTMPIGILKGQFSATGSATTTFTVTLGETQLNNTYNLAIAPTSVMAGSSYYISAKTTTTFDLTYLTAVTGAVNIDWTLFK